MYPAPPGSPADIPGLEIAGEVDAVGHDVTELGLGDRVFGVVGGGGYAEHLTVHARTLARMPDGMSFTDAAAVPEAFVTAWDAMVEQAALTAGEIVLVHAVGSGVGTAALQIAKAIGARTVGTARTADKLERARPLGLDEGLVVDGAMFADEVRKTLPAKGSVSGADVVVELVGGAYVAEDLACLAPKGRIVVVGMMAGARVDLDLGVLMHRRAEVRGTVLRARPLEEKILAARAPRAPRPALCERRIETHRRSRPIAARPGGGRSPRDAEQRHLREGGARGPVTHALAHARRSTFRAASFLRRARRATALLRDDITNRSDSGACPRSGGAPSRPSSV